MYTSLKFQGEKRMRKSSFIGMAAAAAITAGLASVSEGALVVSSTRVPGTGVAPNSNVGFDVIRFFAQNDGTPGPGQNTTRLVALNIEMQTPDGFFRFRASDSGETGFLDTDDAAKFAYQGNRLTSTSGAAGTHARIGTVIGDYLTALGATQPAPSGSAANGYGYPDGGSSAPDPFAARSVTSSLKSWRTAGALAGGELYTAAPVLFAMAVVPTGATVRIIGNPSSVPAEQGLGTDAGIFNIDHTNAIPEPTALGFIALTFAGLGRRRKA
jgi:hypothetical protein